MLVVEALWQELVGSLPVFRAVMDSIEVQHDGLVSFQLDAANLHIFLKVER